MIENDISCLRAVTMNCLVVVAYIDFGQRKFMGLWIAIFFATIDMYLLNTKMFQSSLLRGKKGCKNGIMCPTIIFFGRIFINHTNDFPLIAEEKKHTGVDIDIAGV